MIRNFKGQDRLRRTSLSLRSIVAKLPFYFPVAAKKDHPVIKEGEMKGAIKVPDFDLEERVRDRGFHQLRVWTRPAVGPGRVRWWLVLLS